MILSDYMISETATLLDAAETIAHNQSRCAIITQDDKVIGVISEGDIIQALLRGTDVHAAAALAARKDFKFLRQHDVKKALELFARYGFTLVPVVDDDFRLISVITLKEILPHVEIRSIPGN